MNTAEKTAAGPDYWFVDPAYHGIDRLTEDECPMDEIDKAARREALREVTVEAHTARCYYAGMGPHHPEDCPAGGV